MMIFRALNGFGIYSVPSACTDPPNPLIVLDAYLLILKRT